MVAFGAATVTFSTERLPVGFGKSVTSRSPGMPGEGGRQAPDAVARGDKAAPVGDRGLDRRQRAPHHDRGGDHRAGGHLLPDHEIGAEAEDRRLHQQPQHLGEAAVGIDDVARAADRVDVTVVDLRPARGERAGHSHRDDRGDVAAAGFDHGRAQAAGFVDGAREPAAGAFGLDRDHDQDDRAAPATSMPIHGWIRKQIARKNGIHGRSHDRGRAGAGHERADLIEIAHRLVRLRGIAAARAERDHRAVDGLAQAVIEQAGRAHHDARADQIEDALECVGADQKDRERHQRRRRCGSRARGRRPATCRSGRPASAG